METTNKQKEIIQNLSNTLGIKIKMPKDKDSADSIINKLKNKLNNFINNREKQVNYYSLYNNTSIIEYDEHNIYN